MAKPTAIRIPEELLQEIDQFIQELKLDRTTYLRQVLKKGFSVVFCPKESRRRRLIFKCRIRGLARFSGISTELFTADQKLKNAFKNSPDMDTT
jgi:hypothetical protein